MIQNCPVCGKGFEILWPHLWAYKRSGQFLCSWGCLRESERKGVGKVSRRAKVPEEVKKAAIEAAISGGDPFEELRPYSDNPSKLWHHMKTQLKENDPETYAKIPDLRFRKKEMLHMAPVPDPVVNIDIPEADDLDSCMVTAINVQPYGEFYHDVHHNCIDWRAPDGDEMTMDLVGWKNLSRDLPKILKKLGVVL